LFASPSPNRNSKAKKMYRDVSSCNTYNYGDALYWDARYVQEAESFDWYQHYSSLRPFVRRYIPTSSRVLMVGCGNARNYPLSNLTPSLSLIIIIIIITTIIIIIIITTTTTTTNSHSLRIDSRFCSLYWNYRTWALISCFESAQCLFFELEFLVGWTGMLFW